MACFQRKSCCWADLGRVGGVDHRFCFDSRFWKRCLPIHRNHCEADTCSRSKASTAQIAIYTIYSLICSQYIDQSHRNPPKSMERTGATAATREINRKLASIFVRKISSVRVDQSQPTSKVSQRHVDIIEPLLEYKILSRSALMRSLIVKGHLLTLKLLNAATVGIECTTARSSATTTIKRSTASGTPTTATIE